MAAAPGLVQRSAAIVEVPPGFVDEIAAELLARFEAGPIVALGGGRVIDVAKAVAAARGLPGPVAIPTSLSGAEMTSLHRQARNAPPGTPLVRARAVVNDPALSASQPTGELAASSGNALGHATTALVSTRSTPIARAVALDAIGRMGRAWEGQEPERDELALAAMLSGWAVDRSGLGPHHALSQTAVRVGAAGHGEANAALLPHTVRAARKRLPDAIAGADRVLGRALEDLADDLRDRAGAGLAGMAADPAVLDRAAHAASSRPEMARIPPALTAAEIRAIYVAASGLQ
jgi:alcohol dehydrogenase class IV